MSLHRRVGAQTDGRMRPAIHHHDARDARTERRDASTTRATRATIFNPSARRSARPFVGPSTGDVPATGLGRRREQP